MSPKHGIKPAEVKYAGSLEAHVPFWPSCIQYNPLTSQRRKQARTLHLYLLCPHGNVNNDSLCVGQGRSKPKQVHQMTRQIPKSTQQQRVCMLHTEDQDHQQAALSGRHHRNPSSHLKLILAQHVRTSIIPHQKSKQFMLTVQRKVNLRDMRPTKQLFWMM